MPDLTTRTALTASLIALGAIPIAGHAETPAPQAQAKAQTQAQPAPFPPAQPATPPSERTQTRAPANPAVRSYPRQADGHGIKLGGYNLSRWAEDWTVMRDPKKRHGLLDRLKYLPLDRNGAIYLTLSGEARLRTAYTENPNLADSDYRREDMLRLVGGADLHAGPFRAYGEIAHGGLSGINYGTPAAKSRNDLVVQQAFAELSGPIGPAAAGIRYGRQEFTDGPSTLVSQKDNNTIRASLEGVRAWAQFRIVRVDLFDFKQVKLGMAGTRDDVGDDTTRFSGATFGAVIANGKKSKVFLDPFVWRQRNDLQKWGSVTGQEIRHYYGARLWGNLDRLTFDWTVDHQSGKFAARAIDAWSAFIAQTYLLTPKGLAPKIGVHVDYGSGGGSFGKGNVQAASTVTAGTVAYSYQGALSPTNLVQISPNVTISPVKTIDLTAEYQRSYRADATDAVYRGSGSAYAGSQLKTGNHIGDAARLQAGWRITPRLSLTARYEYFMPSGALAKAATVPSHYLSSWVSYRF